VNQIDTVFLVREEVVRMKLLRGTGYSVAAVLSFALVLLAPGTSAADKKVNAGEILLISDEIRGQSVEIERPDGGTPSSTAPPTLPSGGGDPGSGVATTGGDTSGDDGGDAVASSDEGGGVPDENSRSGLGDGSNPGKGSETNNSPNQGTDNPSASSPSSGHSQGSGRFGRWSR
jgi:hypothetical protein